MVSGLSFLPESSTSGCVGPSLSTSPRFSSGAFNGRRKRGWVTSVNDTSKRGRVLNPAPLHVNDGGRKPGISALGNLEHRSRNAVVVSEPIELAHRPFPVLEAYERERETKDVPEQDPGPAADLVAIGLADVHDAARPHDGGLEQIGQFIRPRTKHRVDRIAVVRIALRDGH